VGATESGFHLKDSVPEFQEQRRAVVHVRQPGTLARNELCDPWATGLVAFVFIGRQPPSKPQALHYGRARRAPERPALVEVEWSVPAFAMPRLTM
jgi:hypothetical protein